MRELVILEVEGKKELMKKFGKSENSIFGVLQAKEHKKKTLAIRRYAIENYTVMAKRITMGSVQWYHVPKVCQGCRHHEEYRNGDYCMAKEIFIRRKKDKCKLFETL